MTALILARFYIVTSRRPTTCGSWSEKLTGCFPIHIFRLVLRIVNSPEDLECVEGTEVFSSPRIRREPIACSDGWLKSLRH